MAKLGSALLVTATILGCSEEVPREERVVAEVAGERVTLGELERFFQASVQQESPVLSPEVMSALFEQFLEERLLLRAADDAGIAADPRALAGRVAAIRSRKSSGPAAPARIDEAVAARDLERHLRIERLLATEVLTRIAVADSEIAEHFDSHRANYERPETVDVSQILVESEELARELRARILSRRESFEDLARSHSQGPEASQGGRMGAFARGELPPSFEAEVFGLAPGSVSEVVATDFGYHIFRVNAKRVEEPLTLDEVREGIRVELLRRKSDEAMERFLDELGTRYPVKVHHQHLSFAVGGRIGRSRED